MCQFNCCPPLNGSYGQLEGQESCHFHSAVTWLPGSDTLRHVECLQSRKHRFLGQLAPWLPASWENQLGKEAQVSGPRTVYMARMLQNGGICVMIKVTI